MDNIFSYICDNAIILIPVLNILGYMLKSTQNVSNKYIPIILLPVGVIFSMYLIGFNVNGVIQGILITGCAVYGNQIIKQIGKAE